MLNMKSILAGSLFIVWLLGCGGALPPAGSAQQAQPANISISPANAVSGSADLTLRITGSQSFLFVNGIHRFSQVVWSANGNNTRLATSFVGDSLLTATVPATLLVSPIQAKVWVEIWDVQGDSPMATSSSVPFSITTASAVSPSITSISPKSVPAGSSDVTLTITGSDFDQPGHLHISIAFWTTDPSNLHDHGTMLNTTVISNNQLTAIIPAALLQKPVSVQIIVLTGDPMGMSDGFFGYPRSNSVAFTVTP